MDTVMRDFVLSLKTAMSRQKILLMSGGEEECCSTKYIRTCKYSQCVHIKFDICRNNFGNFRCTSHPCLVLYFKKLSTCNDHENSGRAREEGSAKAESVLFS